MNKVSVIGLSSGAGVVLYPFKLSDRFEIKYGVECRRDYLLGGLPLQWEENFKGIPYSLDLNIPIESCDVVIGHPKCGMSSVFALSRGKVNKSHKDEPSLSLFIQGIHLLSPKYFLLENLPKLLNTYSKAQFKEIFYLYSLIFLETSVEAFGNSQITRKRLIIIGIRKDIKTKRAEFLLSHPKRVNSIKVTKDLLSNLPQNGNFTESLEDIISVYGGFKMGLKELRDFWKTHPDLTRFPVKRGNMEYAPGVYINHPEAFPKTVRKTNRQFNPEGIQMSPRELARIQGIPDTFKIFQGEGYSLKTLINKGRLSVANTPPYEVGLWFKDTLERLFT